MTSRIVSAEFQTNVILKDGSSLQIRTIRPDDEERLLALFYRLSPQTIYMRFRRPMGHMTREQVRPFCQVDYQDHFALAATAREGDGERIVGVGRFKRLPAGDTAEPMLVVEDAWQGKGVGTHLLDQLVAIARQKGIRRFEAEVLAENEQALNMIKDSGFEVNEELEAGVFRVSVIIADAPAAPERSVERERIATIASLRAFVKPCSIAVIGASHREGTIGNKLFRNLLTQGYKGVVYPVNPNTEVVAAVRAYPSVLDIPGDVDMAVIIVPAGAVLPVVHECGRKGVRGLVIVSAGFGESGAEGQERQDRLIRIARSYGMRVIGPNGMGVINTDPAVSMNATFSSIFPPAGHLGFCSQSGALGLAILEYAQSLNIGLSHFVSIGNRADVSSNDFLQFWEDDPSTSVVLLYLESFGNPRKFAQIARRVSEKKPIVVVKSGRTAAGSRAAASHTGALMTGERTSEALFVQAGIIRVNTLDELFDVANLLQQQPLPPGKRVAILTNGGGPGIMTADACVAMGLEVPALSEETRAALASFLPDRASLANPIDMTAEASAEDYRRALEVLAMDEGVDNVVVIFIPPIVVQPEAAAQAIREALPKFRELGKPLLASFMSARGAPAELGTVKDGYVPCFTFPESTGTALAHAYEYSEWLRKAKGVIPDLPGIDAAAARKVMDDVIETLLAQGGWLDPISISKLLEAYGIPAAPVREARTAMDAVEAASEIGYPVAVKLSSATLTHKTDVGGVKLDLRTADEVEQAFRKIEQKLASLGRAEEMQGVTVQKMVHGGIECIIGVTQDPSFGPLVLFGTGGIYTELFQDVTFRIHPLTDVDAHDMVHSVKVARILQGWRRSKVYDVRAVEDVLLRVSAMVDDLPEIAEIDLNPVKAMEQGKGCIVVDARIRLERTGPTVV